MLKFTTIPLITLTLFLHAGPEQTRERMKTEVDFIKNIFEVSYAPRKWKGERWNLDLEIAKSKKKIDEMAHPTVKGYQSILSNFFSSVRDYHVNVIFYSTELALLPFRVSGANGRYFVTSIDENHLTLPIKCGDELVTFGDQPVEKAVKELKSRYFRGANDATDQSFASHFLTFRSGKAGHKVPKGSISIGIRPQGSSSVTNYSLSWIYFPEEVTNGFFGISEPEAKDLANRLKVKGVGPFADLRFAAEKKRLRPITGYRESVLPRLGTLVWQPSDKETFFDAYIFLSNEGRRVGFIRIPHYEAGAEEAKEFASLIQHFEWYTDALIIDQLDNPGGTLQFCHALASMLSNKTLITPLQQLAITQKDVEEAAELIPLLELVSSDDHAQYIFGKTLFGLHVNKQLVDFWIDYYHFILNEWKAGHKLTTPYFIKGFNNITPHPEVHYSKPILLLINSLCFSCADLFPAILQDNKRATLLGSRTAGAGGMVREQSFPNLFGISHFQYTVSFSERSDKTPIEGFGVTPDISYEVTEEDLQNNYSQYVKAIHNALKKLKN